MLLQQKKMKAEVHRCLPFGKKSFSVHLNQEDS